MKIFNYLLLTLSIFPLIQAMEQQEDVIIAAEIENKDPESIKQQTILLFADLDTAKNSAEYEDKLKQHCDTIFKLRRTIKLNLADWDKFLSDADQQKLRNLSNRLNQLENIIAPPLKRARFSSWCK